MSFAIAPLASILSLLNRINLLGNELWLSKKVKKHLYLHSFSIFLTAGHFIAKLKNLEEVFTLTLKYSGSAMDLLFVFNEMINRVHLSLKMSFTLLHLLFCFLITLAHLLLLSLQCLSRTNVSLSKQCLITNVNINLI